MSAVKFFGENHLQLNNDVAARIGKGLKDPPAIKGDSSSIVVIWRPGGTCKQFIEPSNAGQYAVHRVRFDLERADWAQLRVLQLLMTDDVTTLSDMDDSRQADTDDFQPFWKAAMRPSPAMTGFPVLDLTCNMPTQNSSSL